MKGEGKTTMGRCLSKKKVNLTAKRGGSISREVAGAAKRVISNGRKSRKTPVNGTRKEGNRCRTRTLTGKTTRGKGKAGEGGTRNVWRGCVPWTFKGAITTEDTQRGLRYYCREKLLQLIQKRSQRKMDKRGRGEKRLTPKGRREKTHRLDAERERKAYNRKKREKGGKKTGHV